MFGGESVLVPVDGQFLRVVWACVGPPLPAVGQGESSKLVEVVFEGVDGSPLPAGEVGQEVAVCFAVARDQAGVDDAGEGGDAPSTGCDRCAFRDSVDECVQNLREEEAAVYEQAVRGRR